MQGRQAAYIWKAICFLGCFFEFTSYYGVNGPFGNRLFFRIFFKRLLSNVSRCIIVSCGEMSDIDYYRAHFYYVTTCFRCYYSAEKILMINVQLIFLTAIKWNFTESKVSAKLQRHIYISRHKVVAVLSSLATSGDKVPSVSNTLTSQ